ADMYAEFAELARERELTDTKMLEWAGRVTPAWLDATLSSVSKGDGRRREMPRTVAVLQLFNHGTHHRGQLTTLIKQAGRDPGVTDIPWLPGLVRVFDSRDFFRAPGCAASYALARYWKSRCVYTCVLAMLACPSISCTARKS